jgi:hypothetical protein
MGERRGIPFARIGDFLGAQPDVVKIKEEVLG